MIGGVEGAFSKLRAAEKHAAFVQALLGANPLEGPDLDLDGLHGRRLVHQQQNSPMPERAQMRHPDLNHLPVVGPHIGAAKTRRDRIDDDGAVAAVLQRPVKLRAESRRFPNNDETLLVRRQSDPLKRRGDLLAVMGIVRLHVQTAPAAFVGAGLQKLALIVGVVLMDEHPQRVRGGFLADGGPQRRLAYEQPLARQVRQRLADGGARNAQFLHQQRFRPERLAVHALVFDDIAQCGAHLQVQRRAAFLADENTAEKIDRRLRHNVRLIFSINSSTIAAGEAGAPPAAREYREAPEDDESQTYSAAFPRASIPLYHTEFQIRLLQKRSASKPAYFGTPGEGKIPTGELHEI